MKAMEESEKRTRTQKVSKQASSISPKISVCGSSPPTDTIDSMGRLGRLLRLPTRRLWLSTYEIPSALLQVWSLKGRGHQREYAIC